MPRFALLFALAALFSAAAGPAAAEEAVRLEVQLDRTHYLQDHQTNLFLKATIRTGDHAVSDQRRPLNVALLIDRSGSMEGPKLEAAKRAARHALEQLSSRDIFAVVAYGSEIETPVPAALVDQLAVSAASGIEGIAAGGGSALYDGINQAAVQLRRAAPPGALSRLIVIADGKASKGQRAPEAFAQLAARLAADGIALSAIGLGDEYDEAILFELASASGGTFRDVAQPEDLPAVVAAEIRQLNRAFAKDAVLEITFGRDLTITDTLGRPGERSRQAARFRFDHLYPNQELAVVVAAQLQASGAVFQNARIATATLHYTLIGDDAITVSPLQAEARASFTSSASHSFDSINAEVFQTAANYQVANSVREAFVLLDEGKDKRALGELRRASRALRTVGGQIETLHVDGLIAELNRAIGHIVAAGVDPIERKALIHSLYQRTHRGANNEPNPAAP